MRYRFRKLSGALGRRLLAGALSVVVLVLGLIVLARPKGGHGASGPSAPAQKAKTVADAALLAREGDVIELPAGVYPGGIALPEGVSLRGAGFGKTIIDASKNQVGVSISGGKKAEIADLTVRNAIRTNIQVSDARDFALRRVRSTGSMNGVRLVNTKGARVENVVSDTNRYGIIVTGGEDNAVVNCTAAKNASLGLSFPSGKNLRAFNNCVVGGITGVFVGDVQALALDHNVYHDTMQVGKLTGQRGRKWIGSWRYLSGHDKHSAQLPVTFRKPEAGDFRASSALEWALDRASTADWGIAELAGVKAPEQDITGASRTGPHDAGAYEVALSPPRPADGSLTIKSAEGIKSAGVFTDKGQEVAFLFHDLPLAPGNYNFWLPSRDFLGRPIAAGNYQVSTAESDLKWQYLGGLGDSGAPAPSARTAPVEPTFVAFDDDGHLFVAQGWAEEGVNLRAYEAATGKWLWAYEGRSGVQGLACEKGGTVLLLRANDTKGQLVRLDAKTGGLVRTDRNESGITSCAVPVHAAGLAEVGERLYLADAESRTIRRGPLEKTNFAESTSVESPLDLAADASTQTLWAICGSKLRALDANGKPLGETDAVPSPAALAARGGKLAVASWATGKIHFFDAPDRMHLKPLKEFGRGDGPFGPFAPDRFTFQDSGRSNARKGRVRLALGPKGELAVTDEHRVLVFDSSGRLLWSTFGVFGNGMVPSHAQSGRVWDTDGRISFKLDEANGTWAPEAAWGVPFEGGVFLGDFTDGGKTFGVYVNREPKTLEGNLTVVRYEGYQAKPVLTWNRDEKTHEYIVRKDTNHDGQIDSRDRGSIMPGSDKNAAPVPTGFLFLRFNYLQPSGDILSLVVLPSPVLWKRKGLDADGVPNYRFENVQVLPRGADTFVSPYTFKEDKQSVFYGAALVPGGGYVANIREDTSPGGWGISNAAGTDLTEIDARGQMRWFHSYSAFGGIVGLGHTRNVTVAGVTDTADVLAVNRDGLGLGGFGPPAETRYEGYLLDHDTAVRAYEGRDGHTYVLVSDNFNGRNHWWRLVGADKVLANAARFTLNAATARTLAALPADPAKNAKSAQTTTTLRIPRLTAPLPIDGDLEKWRKAGITPQVIATPETAVGRVSGPADCSAIVRLAYESNNLYVQCLRFDDVVSFHQPAAQHYLQDAMELCINGFMAAFKFDCTKTTDKGEMIVRQRAGRPEFELFLDPTRAPRVIKVLDNAKSVSERELIEGIYGEDLSNARVIVTEFKLPIDAETYKGDPKALFSMKPGATFWLGIMIDDNDEPGTDTQDYLPWPATYGSFTPPETGAKATLE